ncbi:MAG: Sua5/YciO/YrdC/YwlC family protein [Spirochaetota bacterium]|nr:Sua5/YciO/YrdC/YwlC family protein [Spirochaetota bacterium]
MHRKKAEIITIKKLRKDGSLCKETMDRIYRSVLNREIVVMPTDSVYGIITLGMSDLRQRFSEITNWAETKFVRLISSFKMLGNIASINKFEYDFLNRIWPGEVTVLLKNVMDDVHNDEDNRIAVRFPKIRFLHELIDLIGDPLLLMDALNGRGITLCRRKDIVDAFNDRADLILIVEELCRKYPSCSCVDISTDCLKIIEEGKVCSEEIRSLYFLGKADDVV